MSIPETIAATNTAFSFLFIRKVEGIDVKYGLFRDVPPSSEMSKQLKQLGLICTANVDTDIP